MEETIAAISTPFGEGAIALLRLSGPRALEIAGAAFESGVAVAEMASRTQYLGRVMDGEKKLDDALLSIFRAPASYTGEDVVEISCHGGLLITRRILERLLSLGARVAEPGEFTRRAYLSGKLDLTQAEAVMDLISAQTDLALDAAREQLEGGLGRRIEASREELLQVIAEFEAHLDFPEEGIESSDLTALLERMRALQDGLEALRDTAARGRLLREGVRTVIFGAPNVGKSSLLNLLLASERALVSPIPGTTRDSIEEVINLRGIPLRLIDTAGIRDSADALELAGMERTQREAARADLVLHLEDASQPPGPERAPQPERAMLVLNKCDLGEHAAWQGKEAVRVSCLTQEGIAQLEESIAARVLGGGTARRGWALAINARHEAALRVALDALSAAAKSLESGAPEEFAVEELREALRALGEIVGQADSEAVLDRVFANFCIGK